MYNTLLELYLNEIGTCRVEERVTKEMRALELLKRSEVGQHMPTVHRLISQRVDLAQSADHPLGQTHVEESLLH